MYKVAKPNGDIDQIDQESINELIELDKLNERMEKLVEQEISRDNTRCPAAEKIIQCLKADALTPEEVKGWNFGGISIHGKRPNKAQWTEYRKLMGMETVDENQIDWVS